MKSFTVIIIGVFLLFFFGVLVFKNIRPSVTHLTPSSPTISPENIRLTLSPSPHNSDETVINGTVTEVLGTVGYKNATVIKINDITVYITSETVITDQEKKAVLLSTITEGSTLVIEGTPTEGGIEAKNVTVLENSR